VPAVRSPAEESGASGFISSSTPFSSSTTSSSSMTSFSSEVSSETTAGTKSSEVGRLESVISVLFILGLYSVSKGSRREIRRQIDVAGKVSVCRVVWGGTGLIVSLCRQRSVARTDGDLDLRVS